MNLRLMTKKLIPRSVFKAIEPYGHWAEAILENIFYGFPARNLKVIGVTGTAGKTTTSTLITHMLSENGYKVGMLTTVAIDYGDGKGPQHNETRMTSLGSLKMLQTIRQMNHNGVEWLVLETTSHALAQHRVWGVPYSVAVFTNLSPDNADYHGTFEKYREAKLLMFKQCNRNKKGLRSGVINADDVNGKYFAAEMEHPLSYGIKIGDLIATDIKQTARGSIFHVKSAEATYSINTNLPGLFNVYNTLAAIGVARLVGMSQHQIEQSVASLKSVEGRMNSLEEGQDFNVIVDYACTPDSFEKLYAAVKPIAKRRIISVFGSPGRRDVLKRPIQGEIAAKNSDIVIITEEDDRDENGDQIMQEIAHGAEKAGKRIDADIFLIHKREDAVQRAIDFAKEGDTVLLLGKGEERVIITNKPGFKPSAGHVFNEDTDTIRRPYNEADAARQAIRNRQHRVS